MRVAPGIPQRSRDLPTSHQEDPTGLLDLCSASALTPALCAVCGGVSTGLVGLVEPGVRVEGQENHTENDTRKTRNKEKLPLHHPGLWGVSLKDQNPSESPRVFSLACAGSLAH